MLLKRLALAVTVLAAGPSCHAPETGTAVNPRLAAIAPALDPSRSSGKAGHGNLEFRLGYYDNADGQGDGNPFLDETLTVIEPVIYFDYNTTNETAYWTKFSYDNVSSASIERLNTYPGTEQSGATGDYYIGIDIGRRHQDSDRSRHDVWVHGSAEYDYRSFGIGGSKSWDSSDHNRTTKLGGNFFFDDLDLIRFNGKQDGTDNRLSATLNWTEYQVMTAKRHAEYGLTLTYQDGFLGTPFNAVVLEDPTAPPNPLLFNNARGVEIAERLPSTRIRGAIHGRIRQHIATDTALELGGRLYADDWGVFSVSLAPRVYHWLVRDKWRTNLRYRYYTQAAADAFDEHFSPADSGRDYLTQDSDLGDFDSHTLGFGLTWYYSQNFRVLMGADYVKRSDGIDQILASMAMSWSF